MNEAEKASFEKQLAEVSKQGVALYLDGHVSTPEEIARTYAINEDLVYMPDYVVDETGTLREVRYDKIEGC